MSDWRETKESDDQEVESGVPTEKLGPQGIASMQGNGDVRDSPVVEEHSDQEFTDAQERDLTMRTYPSGDSYYVRVYDDGKTSEPPEHPTLGDAGRANLRLERDTEGNVSRARLQDIETTPSYRRAGIGSQMLEQCEDIARRNRAGEIYGNLTPDQGKVEETRQWYAKRGYRFRRDGQEVYKMLRGKN